MALTIVLFALTYPVMVWLTSLTVISSIELIWDDDLDKHDKDFMMKVCWFWPITFPIALTIFFVVLTSRWMRSCL